MWLPWEWAIAIAAVLGVFVAVARPDDGWLAGAHALAKEATLVLVLYAIWQRAGALSIMHVDHALDRAEWLWHAERVLHLPSELTIQKIAMHQSLFVQLCNAYYAVVHAPALIVFLFWLFFRHRPDYPPVRNVLALLTASCLVVQFIPVAPPRMLDHVGFVDTALKYHQSVYTELGKGMSDQLSAMPSVHVAWAALIAIAVWRVSTSRWRWIGVAHLVATLLVVVVTANHFWADGIVAVALLGIWAAVVKGLMVAVARVRPVPEPADAMAPA